MRNIAIPHHFPNVIRSAYLLTSGFRRYHKVTLLGRSHLVNPRFTPLLWRRGAYNHPLDNPRVVRESSCPSRRTRLLYRRFQYLASPVLLLKQHRALRAAGLKASYSSPPLAGIGCCMMPSFVRFDLGKVGKDCTGVNGGCFHKVDF